MSKSVSASATFAVAGTRATVVLAVGDYVSFTGTMEGGGQIVDRLREVAAGERSIERLCDLWDAWHLDRAPFEPECEAAVSEAVALLAELDGGRYAAAIEAGNADDFEDATFSNSDDVIDSRDVIARIEYLRDFLADIPDATPENYDPDTDANGDRMEAVEELAGLVALEDEAENYAADWRYGESLIRYDYFQTYAEEFAEDIGAVKKDAQWPNNHIDWEAAARDLQRDYTEVSFRGVAYFIR